MLSFFIHWCHCRGDADILHQDSAPAHHARQTIELLLCETPKFNGPDLCTPNSPDLDHVRMLSHMERDAGSCVSDINSRRGRYETMPG